MSIKTLIRGAIGAVLGLWLAAAPMTARADTPMTDADRRVIELLAEDYEAQKQFDPLFASQQGDRRFDDRLPDLSAQTRDAWIEQARVRLAAIDAVEDASLSKSNRVNAALLRYELRQRIDGAEFNLHQFAVTPMSGPQQSLPQLPDALSFTTEQHLADYAARLEHVPEYLAQVTTILREGLKSGNTPARIVMERVAAQALAQGDPRFDTEPQAHVMYRPFAAADDAAMAERGRRAISEHVAPAFRAFGEFLRDEYVPGCRESLAARDLPQGTRLYNFMIRHMTTTELTADQIHQIGNREVARIKDEMMDVIARSDFPNPHALSGQELFDAFVAYLRTDPRFYFDNADDLLAGYREIAKRVDADLPRLFGRLPRLPYGVREMPRFIAPSSPTAYYYPGSSRNGVAGYFVANTYRLDQRPKYEMVPLTLHEACPGHHLQIALAQELAEQGMPEWRTTADYTAFVEGWGLYSERLGFEMGDSPRTGTAGAGYSGGRGMYENPYDDFGRLSYEMWRAMRLVVDTGLHAQGWTRQQAITFMLSNSALTEENIEREVDRYIAWPGQALAYKLGELRIRDLRAEAEAALGEAFDVREFHDVVLGQGAVPLEVLAANVAEWVRGKKGQARVGKSASLVSAVYFEGARPRHMETGWLCAIWEDGACVFLDGWDENGKGTRGAPRVGVVSADNLARLNTLYEQHQVFQSNGSSAFLVDASRYLVVCYREGARSVLSSVAPAPSYREIWSFLRHITPKESSPLSSHPKLEARWKILMTTQSP